MLMIVALGNFPSNLTTPVSVARSTVLLASLGGFPSLIAGSQIATKRQPRIKVLVVMHSNSPPHETGTSLLGIPEPAGSCREDRKSTRLNSSHPSISYAVFCLKKKKN